MGVVYEAYDRKRHEIVALKTLQQTEASNIYRFKREFRALADVAHPNLVSLYELLGEGDSWFFTMQLVQGVNFLEYVWEGLSYEPEVAAEDLPTLIEPLEPRPEGTDTGQSATARPLVNFQRLRQSLGQLAEGVCALHSANRLHRDIKPSNVLVTSEGRVVLLDFGLVKEFDSSVAEDSVSVVGTPAYMSPEQALGEPVSSASDWYSIGIMLYQALTGQLPFAGQRLFEMIMRKQECPPLFPSKIVRGVPEDLDRLCEQLLRSDPLARPSGAEVLRILGGFAVNVSGLPAAKDRTAPFVGREPHLATLRDALDSVKEGNTVAISVHGHSGLGKSTLIRHFIDDVQHREKEVVILEGRCYEQESVPYKALDSLMDALSHYLKRFSTHEAEALMPRDCAALARLFPVLQQVDAIASGRRRVLEIPDSQELRRRAFAALRELLIRVADRWPMVLFIDDLQWGDADSAALLTELLRPPDPPALLLIASYRTEEAERSPLLKSFLASLSGFEGIQSREIVVGELIPEEARMLASALLNEERSYAASQAMTIARESGGSPLFIAELARHAEDARQGSMAAASTAEITLDEMIHVRVARLPDEARRFLEVIAVAGQPFDVRVAARAAGLPAGGHDVIGTLRVNHLIRTREIDNYDEIETYHDRVRENVCGHIEPEQLRTHHQNLALALESAEHSDPETLAVHYSGAGDRENAARYTSLAATKASEAFAFDRAARLYQQALELRPAMDGEGLTVRVRLGDALAKAGRGAEAAAAYLQASNRAAAADALELRRQAAEQLLRSGHIDEGLSALDLVLNSMGMSLATTPKRALASLLFRRLCARLRGTAFREHKASGIQAEELTRVDTCWSIGIGLSMVDVIRGADFQARHLLLALKTGEPSRVARAFASEAPYVATIGVRGRRRAERLLREADVLAARVNEPDALGRAKLAAGITAYLTGRWKQAVAFTSSAEQILRERCTGVAWERNTAHHFYLMSCICLGEWREISQRLPALLQEAQERGDLLAEANLGTRMSYLMLLAADEAGRAREQWRGGLEGWSQQGFHTQHYYDLLRQGEIALYAAEPSTGWDFMTSRWGALSSSLILRIQTFRIEVLHLRARIALAAAVHARSEADAAHFRRAAGADTRRLSRERTAWALAFAQLIRAGLASIQGGLDDAAHLLNSAEDSFVKEDMALYAAAARRCRGDIIGGDEGRALVRSADDFMESQKVKNPSRIAAMLVPGRWRNPDRS
jgi:serine/threonine protein kinase